MSFMIFALLVIASTLFVLPSRNKINVVEQGINYIDRHQLENGLIPYTFCFDKKLNENCKQGRNYYITASTVYSLDKIRKNYSNDKLDDIVAKSIGLLGVNMPQNGLWKYVPIDEDADISKIDPDIDDTVLISFVLNKHGYTTNNRAAIRNNRDGNGLFYEWIRASKINNEVDPIVNTNAALYLNDKEINRVICSALSGAIKKNEELSTQSYSDNNYALYYAISRAYTEGIDCFGTEKDLIIKKITADQQKTGQIGENEFTTALALNTLLRFGHGDKDFYNKSFNYLFKGQQEDGGWELYPFYCETRAMVWCSGSRSYATAVALEAITHYYFKK